MERVIAKILGQYESGKVSRRELVQGLALLVAGGSLGTEAEASAAAPFKAIGLNHISYVVGDLATTRDWYRDLLGMEVLRDDEDVVYMGFGDSFVVLRQRDGAPLVNHIAYTIENFDLKAVETELKSRGYEPREDGQSFHVPDPDGYDVQISSVEMTGGGSR
jgi:catechol 2,3-dioxygenase-like lactoylglutathione lyase family enzyme